MAFLLAAMSPAAAAPSSGWWWNPAEGGRGFSLEFQGDTLYFAAFVYDDLGRATWYVAGPASAAGGRFTAPLVAYHGGQSLAGTYRPPVEAAGAGQLSIQFSDDHHATLTWPGRQVAIERFDFGGGGITAPAPQAPETGWWWNEAESGRGFFIEVQQDTLFLAGYLYDESGRPVWYTFGPAKADASGTYRGHWVEHGNGQTMAGPYRPPIQVNPAVGAVTLRFAGTDRATLSLPDGRPLSLSRFRFASISGSDPVSPAPACPQEVAAPLFGTSPVAVQDFVAFRPLGFLSLPGNVFPAKHAAFAMAQPGRTAAPKTVRAPSRAWVSEIREVTSGSTGQKSYQVYLRPCAEVRIYFGQLATLSVRLQAEFNRGAPSCGSFQEGAANVTMCRREGLELTLEEGETIGAGTDGSGVDFGLADFRLPPAPFIDLDHYDAYYPYYASPLNYFRADVRRQIEAKTGSVSGNAMRTAGPVGGSHMQDVPGTVQGNWFIPGSYHSNSIDLSPFLSLVHDYVDVTRPVLAIGTSVPGVPMGLYSFVRRGSGNVNRDFSQVTADGQTYCYEGFLPGQTAGGLTLAALTGVLMLTLEDDRAMLVEYVAAASCSSVVGRGFSSAAVKFLR